MLEQTIFRKNKINLKDYDFEKDLENRNFLSSLTPLEIKVLEELLFSSSTTSFTRFSKDVDLSIKDLKEILLKFTQCSLVQIDGEIIHIDKRVRKYFEFEFLRFDESFKPDIVFINQLLQKIPIHLLPVWYSITKTSNNIFMSIVEKYLSTPQIFKRHINEVENESSNLGHILNLLYSSKELEISTSSLQTNLNLSRNELLENLIYLEFNLLAFICYKKTKDVFIEVLVPLHEYKEFLTYLESAKIKSIEETKNLIKKRYEDYGFIQDLSRALLLFKKKLPIEKIKETLKIEISLSDTTIHVSDSYINNILDKLYQIKFLEENNLTNSALEWLSFEDQNKALHLFYHPLNSLLYVDDSISHLINEKAVKEAEKSILRVLDSGWVYFDDFIKGAFCSLYESQQIKIVPFGKGYKYNIPSFKSEEIKFIKKIIFERLFETAIVSIGSINAKDCFSTTNLGKTLFDQT